jgi:hypothetical protein
MAFIRRLNVKRRRRISLNTPSRCILRFTPRQDDVLHGRIALLQLSCYL